MDSHCTISSHFWNCCSCDSVVTISNHEITSLAFGKYHCLFLTTDKKVYSFGKNSHGQLGTGDKSEHLKEPYYLFTLPQNINSISCGTLVSAALTVDGCVYMWGDNEANQCGTKDSQVLFPKVVPIVETPTCMHVLPNRYETNKIVQISCGTFHTMALTSNNDIWIWGSGIQLGIPESTTSEPIKLRLFSGRKILSISCGYDYSLAVVTSVMFEDKERNSTNDNANMGYCMVCMTETQNICPLGLPMDSTTKELNDTNPEILSSTSENEEGENKAPESKLEVGPENTQSSEVNKEIKFSLTESNLQHEKLTISDNLEDLEKQRLSDVELRKGSNNSSKRGGSLLDTEVAKLYLEKFTDDVFYPKEQAENSDDSENKEFSEKKESKLPFVWGVVSKMRNSLEKIQMGNFGILSSGGQLEKSFSQESFEVLETNLIETETSSFDSSDKFDERIKRTGSFKSLLELKQGQKVKEATRKTSIEALVTISRGKGKKNSLEYKSKLLKSAKRNENGHVLAQTEVWSWGSGNFGQLGHGDEMDRNMPCCVKQLSGHGVVKVFSGHGHSAALTADGRILSWGLNSDGQLGHSFTQEKVLTPKAVEVHNLIWDVAIGDKRTIFLVDHKAPRVAMYYCGAHELIDDTTCVCPKEKGIHQLNILKKSGLIEKVFAGGSYCGCLVNLQGLSELPVLHEFAATERQFLYQLQVMLTKLLRPLLKGPISTMQEVYADPLKCLIAKLTTIVDMVAVNSYDLTLIVLSKGHLDSISFVMNYDEWVEQLFSYSDLLCNVISINGCAALAREWSMTPNSLKMLARDILGEASIDNKTSAEILVHLLSIPKKRIQDYVKLLNKIATSNLKCVRELNIQDLLLKTQVLLDSITYEFKLAEKTKKFWEAVPQKIIDNYRIPTRRLIRESKDHPINLVSSGRFSSHWFILFNDIIVHQHFSTTHSYSLQLIWVEPMPDTESITNGFVLRMPEDVFIITATTSVGKTDWVCALNASIRQLLDNEKDPLSRLRSHSGGNGYGNDTRRLSPPLPRQGSYTFLKTPFFKDGAYTGMWLCAKVHGHGTLVWPDNRKYVGKFKQNVLQGEGIMTSPHGDKEYIYQGFWQNNKLSGYGSIKYPNGDLYEGYFKDGLRHGHGMLKTGQFRDSFSASVYIGQWFCDQRSGYGVLDNIPMGEKYMGMWQDDCKSGKGLVVTIDGIYYEGTFVNDKLQGVGVMMFEDGTFFEGELGPNGTLDGKGILYLSNGDHIDGTFNGIWSSNSGIKTNGYYHKSTSISSANDIKLAEEKRKWNFGQLCVPADDKWIDIFNMCKDNMGIQGDNQTDNTKTWESIAIAVAKHKKSTKHTKRHQYMPNFDVLERIPKTSTSKQSLTVDDLKEIEDYLTSACDCPFHPIGQLFENIVNVYRAAYLGIGAHKTLLPHAVSEINMFTSKTYQIIRLLFPDLPKEDEFFSISSNTTNMGEASSSNADHISSSDSDEGVEENILSPSSLLHPLLLPRLYPIIFTIYALHNEQQDTQYWKRILKWNRQADISLMSFLGVHQKFWMMKVTPDILADKLKNLSSFKDIYFATAVDTLQRISTEFTPKDKLKTIHHAFKEINEEVQKGLNDEDFLWNMDDLFPVFQYVVVRSRIRHLGSEIHFIGDLMEKHYEMGELGLMFTTLKACYFQIRTEKAQQ